MEAPRLSVVIPSWNTRDVLRACLAALRTDAQAAPGGREVVVVDNASGDGSPDMVAAEFPDVVLLRNAENRLYSEANNQGAALATGTYLCLLNSDTEVRPGALERLAGFLDAHPGHGGVAPRLIGLDGLVQRSCNRFPTLLDSFFESTSFAAFPPGSWVRRHHTMASFDHASSRDVPQPPASCFVMRREEYVAMGGFDTDMSLFFNDVDLCRRLWDAGRRIHYLADAEVVHHGGHSVRQHAPGRRNLVWTRNRAAYFAKHHGPAAQVLLRGIVHAWALECALRIRLGPRERPAKREALAELRTFVHEALAP